MSGIRPWVRALERTRSFAHLTLPGLIEQLAETHGERLALLDQREFSPIAHSRTACTAMPDGQPAKVSPARRWPC